MFLYLVLIINVVTFIVYGIDKQKARRGKWRIPESTLLLLALMGGSIGAWFGLKMWRHKTKHRKFTICIPLFMILHLGIIISLLVLFWQYIPY